MFHAHNSFPERFKRRLTLVAVEKIQSDYIGQTIKETPVGDFDCVVIPLSPKMLIEENLNQSKIYYSVYFDSTVSIQPNALVVIDGEKFVQDIPPKKFEGMQVLRIAST